MTLPYCLPRCFLQAMEASSVATVSFPASSTVDGTLSHSPSSSSHLSDLSSSFSLSLPETVEKVLQWPPEPLPSRYDRPLLRDTHGMGSLAARRSYYDLQCKSIGLAHCGSLLRRLAAFRCASPHFFPSSHSTSSLPSHQVRLHGGF